MPVEELDWLAEAAEDRNAMRSDSAIPWSAFENAKVLVTGASGVVGGSVVESLLSFAESANSALVVYALVRDVESARARFQMCDGFCHCRFVEGDVRESLRIGDNIDYIVHAASMTDSLSFVERPVDVIDTSLGGTKNVLEYARKTGVKGVVFLSTMEVYGASQEEDLLTEESRRSLDYYALRSCYPESKRMSENMCLAYWSQYGVPVVVARLAQTFGPGVSLSDSRVFSYFAKCALDGNDIVLKTNGKSKRCYVYTLDAVSALLILLVRGKRGEAYNVANEQTYCSILEMANMVAKEIAYGSISVRIQLDECSQYLPPHCLKLSSEKLRQLGWSPHYSLEDMYRKLIGFFSYRRRFSKGDHGAN